MTILCQRLRHSKPGDERGVCWRVMFSFASLFKQKFLHIIYFPLSLPSVERNPECGMLVSLSRKGKHNWYAESFASLVPHGLAIHPFQKKHDASDENTGTMGFRTFLVRDWQRYSIPKNPTPKKQIYGLWCWRHHLEKVVCRCLTTSQCQCGFQAFPRHANSEVLECIGYVV